ncbi:glycosyltransferase [Tenacibaculum dicentrarchi]|nr:glycosyltransferase [Tenacibaculum dicentrarchi]
MKIFTVVVTNNRTNLLKRALESISNQTRKPDFVVVVSNSTKLNQLIEKKLCLSFGFDWLMNLRTSNYAGGLNTGIEHYLKYNKIDEKLYFSSLDDDDQWNIDYLYELEKNGDNTDIILANIIRDDSLNKRKLYLPEKLDFHSFLGKNPGVGGSNTFIRLKTLLKSGAFDEAMNATVDRDVFVRLFLLKPTFKIINKHLVTLYVENDRKRVTTDKELKKKSYQYFYYKYQNIMNISDKKEFFFRAITLFKLNKKDIDFDFSRDIIIKQNELTFDEKIDFQFIVGFIAGEKTIALRIIQAIIFKNIRISKLIIIDNLKNSDDFVNEKKILNKHNIKFKIVKKSEWSENLQNGYYGEYFKKYSKINSIPIGRTILQHHLYTETITFENPVFWVIDDDISFTNTLLGNKNNIKIDLFKIINENINNCDALIGSVSKDPPLPFLSSIRGQLIDLYYSSSSLNKKNADYGNLRELKDYYYDITDAHFNHLETPIYYHSNIETDLSFIFSGKSVSRPCLQKKIKGETKLVSNRGPNTLIFNRDLLKFYPVVNMEINDKFVRRGDLLWALLNQLISNIKIIDHTFCIDQDRPLIEFDIKRELDKSANDIIGYAFNKAIIQTISIIKVEIKPNNPTDIYRYLNTKTYFNQFILIYKEHLSKRKSRFLMNYYRIEGLINLINQKKDTSFFINQFSDEYLTDFFLDTITSSESEISVKCFLETLSSAICTYEDSIKYQMEAKIF